MYTLLVIWNGQAMEFPDLTPCEAKTVRADIDDNFGHQSLTPVPHSVLVWRREPWEDVLA